MEEEGNVHASQAKYIFVFNNLLTGMMLLVGSFHFPVPTSNQGLLSLC